MVDWELTRTVYDLTSKINLLIKFRGSVFNDPFELDLLDDIISDFQNKKAELLEKIDNVRI